MAIPLNIDNDKFEILKVLQKTVQSCNLNFLIGSGCTVPAITALGAIEKDVEDLYKKSKTAEAEKKLKEFLLPFLVSTRQLLENKLDKNHVATINNYKLFLNAISEILFERKSHILHKQASVFTTNYDMFIERAIDDFSESIVLNDGFCRNPSLSNSYSFSPRAFFNTVYNTGNLYKYQVEIPSVNLIKMHGSINWQVCDGKIYQTLGYLESLDGKAEKDFIDSFSLILPRKDKFRETLLNQTYYDLLRIFSNELDKENTLLVAEGFSFADEHILDLTKRALKNPTLRVVVFCYQKSELGNFNEMFFQFNNVNIIYSEKTNIDFTEFNKVLSEVLPKKVEVPVCKSKETEFKDA